MSEVDLLLKIIDGGLGAAALYFVLDLRAKLMHHIEITNIRLQHQDEQIDTLEQKLIKE